MDFAPASARGEAGGALTKWGTGEAPMECQTGADHKVESETLKVFPGLLSAQTNNLAKIVNSVQHVRFLDPFL